MLIFPFVHFFIYEFTNHVPLLGKRYDIFCALDERLPLLQWFFIPYAMWFVMIAGSLLLLLLTDMTALKRMVKCLMVTVISVYPVFIFFPTRMPLRPYTVSGAGILSRIINLMFSIDEPCNVFPSLHVVWAVAAMFALWRTKHFSSKAGKLLLLAVTFMISVSTFMIKQHSVLDVIGAVPFCWLGWYLCYSEGTA